MGCHVVAGEGGGQLLTALGLEITRRGQVSIAALRSSEPRVGNLSDQRLDEAVLAALGRTGVGVDVNSSRLIRPRS